MLDNAMKGEIEMDNKRQAEEDYLYHCNGCNKADKNYPDKMTECEECEGSGAEVIDDKVVEESCWYCKGFGEYRHQVDSIEYHEWARSDAYGLFTGLYCHKCYKDQEKYTYRKDRYFDEGYAGENLEGDY